MGLRLPVPGDIAFFLAESRSLYHKSETADSIIPPSAALFLVVFVDTDPHDGRIPPWSRDCVVLWDGRLWWTWREWLKRATPKEKKQ